MRILVTGGHGFIGSHLLHALRGHDVIDYSITSGNDIMDEKILNEHMRGIDIVFHLAAVSSIGGEPSKTFETNTKGTMNVLNACRKHDVKKIIFASSAAVYGDIKIKASEDIYCEPISVYGASKLAAECYINAYAHCYGLPSVILRYFNVYGPGGHSVINKFVDDIARGQQIIIFGNGSMKRDYIYVDDVVRANLLAMKGRKTGTYNVGTGIATTVSRLIDMISKVMGKKPLLTRGKPREGEIFYSCADIRKAGKMLGFRYKISLERGIKNFRKIRK